MHPLFARLKADLEEAKREYRNIEDTIRMFDALGPDIAMSWARRRAVAAGIDSVY